MLVIEVIVEDCIVDLELIFINFFIGMLKEVDECLGVMFLFGWFELFIDFFNLMFLD